jgi:hypothetical protein
VSRRRLLQTGAAIGGLQLETSNNLAVLGGL